jgi:hypothetical protein
MHFDNLGSLYQSFIYGGDMIVIPSSLLEMNSSIENRCM